MPATTRRSGPFWTDDHSLLCAAAARPLKGMDGRSPAESGTGLEALAAARSGGRSASVAARPTVAMAAITQASSTSRGTRRMMKALMATLQQVKAAPTLPSASRTNAISESVSMSDGMMATMPCWFSRTCVRAQGKQLARGGVAIRRMRVPRGARATPGPAICSPSSHRRGDIAPAVRASDGAAASEA